MNERTPPEETRPSPRSTTKDRMTPHDTWRPARRTLAAAVMGLMGACGSNQGAPTGSESGATTATYTLLLGTSATRSSPAPLSGAGVSGSAYIFTSDASDSPNPAGIKQVRYWLDNTAMTGAPTHVESYAPFDFVGTGAGRTAEAWSTSGIASGTHTITQSVTPTSGAVETYTATFAVSSSSAHSVALRWTASTTPNVTYDAYRSQGCTGNYVMQASGLTATTWEDSAVTSGDTYCYVTTAVSSSGQSVDSNAVQAVIP